MVYHNHDTSGLIPFQYLTISKKTLLKLLIDNIIRGEGTKENLYEIHDMEKIPDVLIFRGVQSYFRLTNGNFRKVSITKCQNITGSHYKLINLELLFNSNLNFTNNIIQFISIKKSKGNIFQHNKLSHQAEKNLQKRQFFFPFESFMYFMMVTIAMGFANFILFFIITGMWYNLEIWIFFLSLFILFICIRIFFALRFLKEFWFYLKSSKKRNFSSENEILA